MQRSRDAARRRALTKQWARKRKLAAYTERPTGSSGGRTRPRQQQAGVAGTRDTAPAARMVRYRLPRTDRTPGRTPAMAAAIEANKTLGVRAVERLERGLRGVEKLLTGSTLRVIPKETPAHLIAAGQEVASLFRRPGTFVDYGSYIVRFMKWAKEQGLPEDPDNRETVGIWFLELYSNGKHSIIVQALKAMRLRWKLTSPHTLEHVITSLMVGAASQRVLAYPAAKSIALSGDTVVAVVASWGAESAPIWKQMVALAILIQFAAALRFHGLTQLLTELMWEQPQGVMAFVEDGKTKNHGFFIPIGKSGGASCPAVRLLKFREHPGWEKGPLLRKLVFSRRRKSLQQEPTFASPAVQMTHSQYSSLLSQALKECASMRQEEASRVTPHSIRRSSISAMAAVDVAGRIPKDSASKEASFLKQSQIPGFLRRAHAGHAEPGAAQYETADGYVAQLWEMRMRIPRLLGL